MLRADSLDLNLLRILDALLRERSVTRAATSLQLSQPAASHALARLRRTLDDPLLVRQGNRMVLTREGERLQPLVAQIMHVLRDEIAAPEFDPASSTISMTISMPEFMHRYLLPHLMPAVRAQAPGIRIDLVSFHYEARELFERNDLDALVGWGQAIPKRNAILEPLCTIDWCGIASADNDAVSDRMTLQEYCALPHVIYRNTLIDRLIDSTLARQGLRRQVVTQIPNGEHIAAVLSGTDMVSFGSHTLHETALRSFALPLEIPSTHFSVARPAAREKSPAGRWLSNQLLLAARHAFPDHLAD